MKRSSLKTIGWREWVVLPGMGRAAIKAKVDTGARSSSLHAFNVRVERRRGVDIVLFELHPLQRSDRRKIRAEAPLVEMRKIRSSDGHESLRPVIETEIELMGERWPIELTLATRDTMGFRMLLGRQAIRSGFVVDAGRSFLGGIPKPKKKRKKRAGTGGAKRARKRVKE
jgi:hypothetical protein